MDNESFDEKVRKRIDWIKEKTGDDTIKILEKMGLDVDEALKGIVTEKINEQEHQRKEKEVLNIEGLPLTDCMTSELIILHDQFRDNKYLEELQRRLNLLGLTDEQQEIFEKSERERAKNRPFPALYTMGLVRHYFLMDGIGIENIPTPQQCLTSELFAIFDDAHAAWVRDRRWLQKKTVDAIEQICGSRKASPYFEEYNQRVKEWNWTSLQRHSYNKNEILILGRVKWGHHNTLAWQPETMVTQEELDE